MSKKYDIRTRQGRSRRRSDSTQFNPDTLLPHTAKFIAERKAKRMKRKAS